MHYLDGAYQRVNRANEHLADLHNRIVTIYQTLRDEISSYREPMGCSGVREKCTVVIVKRLNNEIPEIISILVGEIVYNLRTALDYLVYELARLDSGKLQDGTQFPICDSINGFERNKRFLKGIDFRHVSSIESLQPYKGCDWTKSLRDLSNLDKHRQLIIVKSDASGEFPKNKTPSFPTKNPMDVESYISFNVTFSGGMPVEENLQELIMQVTKTLDGFKPEFQ